MYTQSPLEEEITSIEVEVEVGTSPVTVVVEVVIDVDVVGIDVGTVVSQEASQRVAMSPPKAITSQQTAVQPSLVTVTVAIGCLLARAGLPVTLVALAALTRLSRPTRPKTTELVTRILLIVNGDEVLEY